MPIATPAAAQTDDVDYRSDANWLCRPGRADACAGRLDAVTLTPDGRLTPEEALAAKEAWLSRTLLEWGSCGRMLSVDGMPAGYALFDPTAAVPGAARA